jgi:hypothetical protein
MNAQEEQISFLRLNGICFKNNAGGGASIG